MKSTRITKKLNKPNKNKTSKKCKLEKRVSKKHVKRSIEKKSRKMRGGATSVMERAQKFGEVVNRRAPEPAGEYAEPSFPLKNILVAAPNLPPKGNGNIQAITNRIAENHNNINNGKNGNEVKPENYKAMELTQPEKENKKAYNSFRDVVAEIIKLLEVLGVKPKAVLDIQTALYSVSSLSEEEFSKLQKNLVKLIVENQPIYEEIGRGIVIQPRLPERNQKKPTGNSCSNKSKKDCEESPECELVKTKTRKFGIPKTVYTCVKKETITPQTNEQPVPNPELNQKQVAGEPTYLEANNRPKESGAYVAFAPAILGGQNQVVI